MAKRGTATLPLHGGRAPPWLFERMVDLAGAIVDVIVAEFGSQEMVKRLADPYWFQALGCTLGFDWHSSGLTTTTMGALKASLDPSRHGLVVAGGKGATSRRTPAELRDDPLELGTGAVERLVRSSRLSASVDNGCIQDRFTLYHHTMVVAEDGRWGVVQQGMDESLARRYHWADEAVDSFVETPQAAIASQARRTEVLDLTADRSADVRSISVDLANEPPHRIERLLRPVEQRSLDEFGATGSRADGPPEYRLPTRHELHRADLSDRAIAQLEHAYERQVDDYEELVETAGVGRGSLRALALIAELLYDAETSREDPAKFSFAHGGKDGIPYPVDRPRYDRSIEFLREMLDGAELDRRTHQSALDRLRTVA